jgi:hypothetical protein
MALNDNLARLNLKCLLPFNRIILSNAEATVKKTTAKIETISDCERGSKDRTRLMKGLFGVMIEDILKTTAKKKIGSKA